MKTLKDLFEHQLKDLHNAEQQLIAAIPDMIEKASNQKLKTIFEDHLEETKRQKERIVEICEELDIKPKGETCKAMKGIIQEAKDFIKHDASSEVMDAGLIAQAQRVEHYEITGYGTAVRYAKELGYNKISKKLQETLDEEYKADESLNKLAESRLNEKAVQN